MFLFDIFTDLARPFWDAQSQIEDCDDEVNHDPMHLADNASQASLLDDLEAKADITMPASTHIPNAVATPNTPPISPYASSHLHKLSMAVDDLTTKDSKKHYVHRHTRTSTRHTAYPLPSLQQRQAFKRRSPRKKEMFVEGPHLPFVPPVEPIIVSPTADLVLPSMHVEVSPTLLNPIEIYLSSQFSAHCNVAEGLSTPTDTVLTPTLTPHGALHTSQKSGLTIKIPGLVDRLALRLLSSCSVTEQTKEEDLDDSPLGGHASLETSSEDDVEDDHNSAYHSSSSSPDRTSRRNLRRGAASPYHRVEGKRKASWLEVDTPTGGEVPDFLLGALTTGHTRAMRSGHPY